GLATTIKLLGSVNARKMAFAADTVVLPNWREQLRIPRFAVERRIPHWISSGSKLRRVRANSTGSSDSCGRFMRLALIILFSKNMNSLEVLRFRSVTKNRGCLYVLESAPGRLHAGKMPAAAKIDRPTFRKCFDLPCTLALARGPRGLVRG